ncbi:MAG: aminopeptidase P N-terminal domain-containing protein, partial [Bdellovibrionales bacterium]
MNLETVFTSEFFSANRKRLRELFGGAAPIVITANGLLQKTGDSVLPFSQDNNFWYLTGVDEPGLILVMESDREYVILPKKERIQEIFEGSIDKNLLGKVSGIEEINDFDEGWKQLSKRLKKVKHVATIQPPKSYIEQLGIYTNPSKARLIRQLREYNDSLSLIDLRPFLASMRSVKSDVEMAAIKVAIRETEDFYKLLQKHWLKATSEAELFTELKIQVAKRGIDFAYDPIIASGINSITLHYMTNDADIDFKNFLLIDLAAKA